MGSVRQKQDVEEVVVVGAWDLDDKMAADYEMKRPSLYSKQEKICFSTKPKTETLERKGDRFKTY